MKLRMGALILSLALFGTFGCNKPSQQGDSSATPGSDNATQGSATPAQPRVPETITVPSGKVLTVQLAQTVGSKASQPGQSFGGSLAKAVEVNGEVAI